MARYSIMFASSSRLDLDISVRPKTLGDVKAVLSDESDPLPIPVNSRNAGVDITRSETSRMRAALENHRDRVREIISVGQSAKFDKYFKKFIKVTNCTFPVLESLSMDFREDDESRLINTLLGGPDPSFLHLKRLGLHGVTFASISGLLSSSTSLTELL